MPSLGSERLRYQKLTASDVSAWLRIVQHESVRRYLFDGETMTRPWCESQVAISTALFEERGVGLWLAFDVAVGSEPLGFCGFIRFEETGDEPQLVYALLPGAAGRGLATEMSIALLDYARAIGFDRVISAADAPNLASIRVLEKTGFVRTGTIPGAFGEIITFVCSL